MLAFGFDHAILPLNGWPIVPFDGVYALPAKSVNVRPLIVMLLLDGYSAPKLVKKMNIVSSIGIPPGFVVASVGAWCC